MLDNHDREFCHAQQVSGNLASGDGAQLQGERFFVFKGAQIASDDLKITSSRPAANQTKF